MNKTIMSTGLRWLWLSLIVLLLDLSSKQWVLMNFCFGESVPMIPYINFICVKNPGAAFSLLKDGGGWQRWVFSVIAIVIILILLVIMYTANQQNRLSNIANAMIIGGALGNLLDRIVQGAVIDFIDFHAGNWHWPTFNVADASICIGATLSILEKLIDNFDKKV